MSDIRISPLAQVVMLLVLVGLIGGAVAAQLPEIQRYLKIRSMD